jgi:cytochrome c556
MRRFLLCVSALGVVLGAGVLAQKVTTVEEYAQLMKANAQAIGGANKIVKDGLTRLDALDKTLSAPTVDPMAAQAAAKEFGGATCGACHKLYREGDAQSGFKFKAGVI